MNHRVVYSLVCLLHFAAVIAVLYDYIFAVCLVIELAYFFYRKSSKKLLVKMIMIAAAVGILNLFHVGGKIIVSAGILKITEAGLKNAVQNAAFVLGLFLFTNNFFSAKAAISANGSSLLSLSIRYFAGLCKIITHVENPKRMLQKIAVLYYSDFNEPVKHSEKKIGKSYIVYNVSVLAVGMLCAINLIILQKTA